MEHAFTFDNAVIEAALETIYQKRINTAKEIDAGLYSEVLRGLNSATDSVLVPAHRDSFAEVVRGNNAVFSAFKVHRMGRDMASRMLDADGNLKSFEQFRTDTEGIVSHHVDAWLRTEFNTAVRRAHKALDMQRFREEADVFPNIKWLPSTAINPRESHIPFYDHVWAVDDPFWLKHKPGDEWGCQCDWEATDEPVTDNTGLDVHVKSTPGLGGDPSRSGEMFSDDHPYFPSECKGCPFDKSVLGVFRNKVKSCYECKGIKSVIKTSEDKHKQVLEKQKNIALSQISSKDLPAPIVYSNMIIKYGTVVCSKKDIRNLVYHTVDSNSIQVAMSMDKHLDKLKYIEPEVPKHFTDKKHRRGLIEYTVYGLTIDNNEYIVKCEARRNTTNGIIKEHPYSIYKK